MKKIRLPVTWESSGFVDIEAETIEVAIEYFNNNVDRIPLPYDSEYVDGSFLLSSNEVEFIELYNKAER